MLSVIIPCYNQLPLLLKTLKSFCWQDFSFPFEIILIDNNSNVDNLSLAYDKYFSILPLYLIKQPKLSTTYSLCAARNLGLKIAKYDWILTLDSDCMLNPTYFSSLKKYIHNKNSMIIAGERKFIFSNEYDDDTLTISNLNKLPLAKSASNYFLPSDRRLQFVANLASCSQPWAYMHGGNCIFNRRLALDINAYDQNYDGHWGYEDIDFAYRYIKSNKVDVVFDTDLFVYHQEDVHSTELTYQKFDKTTNPNWKRVCETISGFEEFKRNEYKLLNGHLNSELMIIL